MKVGVLIFDGVEELDFVGPWEVLSYANKLRPDSLEMLLVGTHSPVRAFNGLRVIPDVTIDNCPQLDILVVPGGKGRMQEMRNQVTLEYIRAQYPGLRMLASVCTGAFLLAEANLLAGKRATTHYTALEELKGYHSIEVREERITRSGNILCAAGVSSGMDLALYLLGELFGPEMPREVAKRIEYPYTVYPVAK